MGESRPPWRIRSAGRGVVQVEGHLGSDAVATLGPVLPAPLSGDRTARSGSAHWAWSDARAAGCTALPAAMGEDRHRHRPSWSRHAFGGGSHGRHRGAAHTYQATDRPARAADGPQTFTSRGAPGDSGGGTGAHRVLPNGGHPLLPHDPHIAMAVTPGQARDLTPQLRGAAAQRPLEPRALTEDPTGDPPRYAWRGVRPIHSSRRWASFVGPLRAKSWAHSGQNRGGRTMQPALRAGRAFARI